MNNNTSITGTLTTTLPIQTPTIEGRGIGGTGSPLKIGQSNDYASYVDGNALRRHDYAKSNESWSYRRFYS
jgi:hypothetical protein